VAPVDTGSLSPAADGCPSPSQFRCITSRRCIPKSWYCDGDCDCYDCTDECGKCFSPVVSIPHKSEIEIELQFLYPHFQAQAPSLFWTSFFLLKKSFVKGVDCPVRNRGQFCFECKSTLLTKLFLLCLY